MTAHVASADPLKPPSIQSSHSAKPCSTLESGTFLCWCRQAYGCDMESLFETPPWQREGRASLRGEICFVDELIMSSLSPY